MKQSKETSPAVLNNAYILMHSMFEQVRINSDTEEFLGSLIDPKLSDNYKERILEYVKTNIDRLVDKIQKDLDKELLKKLDY